MKYLALGVKIFVIATAALAFIFFWQILEMSSASDSARRLAGREWASISASRIAFFTAYENECEHPDFNAMRNETKKHLLSFRECSQNLALEKSSYFDMSVEEAESLGQAMQVATDRIVLPVPLRWIQDLSI
ncbi:hypothetical protein LT85_p005 (plasmid) [Collimonas arenae]|uniref:Uncharacterized protein n=1 Tax=Collimonas arenae TaxID=279058 RepID=A0A0A1FKH9_9BURK|nr:hypothetical protein [Collimonas arenae]AIY44184.1 hypothetical protein LT85_p005 [Collimonas arenae]